MALGFAHAAYLGATIGVIVDDLFVSVGVGVAIGAPLRYAAQKR
jgi:hypothetical protein